MRIDAVPQTNQLSPEQAKLWTSCQQLEQVFLEIMLQQMNKSISNSDLLPESFQGGVYKDMQQKNLAESMAKSGGVGLATTLYRQLNRMTIADNPVKP